MKHRFKVFTAKIVALCMLGLILCGCSMQPGESTASEDNSAATSVSSTDDAAETNGGDSAQAANVSEPADVEDSELEMTDVDAELGQPFTVDFLACTLTYTVTSAEVFDNLQDSGLNLTQFSGNGEAGLATYEEAPDGTTFVLFDVSVRYDYVETIDVEVEEPRELNINQFLVCDAPYTQATAQVELCYFDQHTAVDTTQLSSNYFHYFLNSGETGSYKIGAFIPTEWVEANYCYLILNNGDGATYFDIRVDL